MRARASVLLTVVGVLTLGQPALSAPVHAQTTTLRGRVVSLDGSPTADRKLRLVSLGDLVLFDSGEFSVEVPADLEEVEVATLEDGVEVVYPTGGRLAIPRGNQTVTIVVGEPAINAVRSALAERSRLLNQVLEANSLQDQQFASLDQSLREILDRLDLREEDLRDEVQRRDERAKWFPEINAAVRDYILQARDLHDVLTLVGGASESPERLYESLAEALPPYDRAYTRLKSGADGFVEVVERYWDGGDRLGAELEDFWEDGIEDFHRTALLPLNEPLAVIQDQAQRGRSGSRESREAREALLDGARPLDLGLDELEREAEALLATLAAN